MATTKQTTKQTNQARAALAQRASKAKAKAAKPAPVEVEADESEVEADEGNEGNEGGSQWARERERIADGKGSGQRFTALAAAMLEAQQAGKSHATFADIAQRTAAHTRNGKALTRTSVASWRTLLQRAKQTPLGPDLANVRIDETGFSFAKAE